MAADNRRAGHTGRARRFNKFLALNGERLPAYNPRHGQPLNRANRRKDQKDIALKNRQQQNYEEDEWHGVKHIHKAHHEIIDTPADKARHSPPCHPDDKTDNRRHNAHHKRDAQANHQASEQVSPLLVGSQYVPVLECWRDA